MAGPAAWLEALRLGGPAHGAPGPQRERQLRSTRKRHRFPDRRRGQGSGRRLGVERVPGRVRAKGSRPGRAPSDVRSSRAGRRHLSARSRAPRAHDRDHRRACRAPRARTPDARGVEPDSHPRGGCVRPRGPCRTAGLGPARRPRVRPAGGRGGTVRPRRGQAGCVVGDGLPASREPAEARRPFTGRHHRPGHPRTPPHRCLGRPRGACPPAALRALPRGARLGRRPRPRNRPGQRTTAPGSP